MGLFETEDTIDDRLQTVRGNGAVHFDEVGPIASENNSDRSSRSI